MTTDGDRTPIGDPTLDTMLAGGFPSGHPYLVTGSAGTGKSTLGMQFVQTGIQAGDRCLYISTEHTPDQLRTTFDPYEWDLDAGGLEVISVTPQPGTVDGDQALTLETVDGTQHADAFNPATISEIVTRYVHQQVAPVDRVTVDSLSALANVHQHHDPQSTIVDLMRLFSDELEATVLYTTDDGPAVDPAPYLTQGTLTLRRQWIDGDPHTTAQITDLDGVDYDRRLVELQFSATGVAAAPRQRAMPASLNQHDHVSIGIPGLDELAGGGVVTGSSALITHDGRVPLGPLLTAIIASLHDRGYAVTLLPTMDLRPARLQGMLAGHGIDMPELLRAGELYIVDFTGAWDTAESNVYGATDDRTQLEGVLREVDELTEGRRATLASADNLAHTLGTKDVRALRYYQEGQLLGDDDVLFYVQNPTVLTDQDAAFFVDTAHQVFDIRLTDDGRSYLTLETSPGGAVGTTALLEHVDDPPYVRVDPTAIP